ATMLPVTFGSISASINNANNVSVEWTTEQETNNAYFEIEASDDGKTFTPVAKVLSKADNGNSDVPVLYSWESSSAFTLSLVPLIGFILVAFSLARSKKSLLTARLSIIAAIVFLAACTKSGYQVT